MRKLIDYFWSFVRRGQLQPYEHGPAAKLYRYIPVVERDETGKFIRAIEEETCGENCKCKDK
jgi:hypothetical protein